MPDDRRRLLDLLARRSFRQGRVVLTSGKESDFYIDCKQTTLCAEGHLLVGRLLYSLIRERFPEARAVGGPTLGADPMVSAISTYSAISGGPTLDAFIIRKEPKGHGTGAWVEGLGNLGPACPVVVCEDVITTGGSTLRSLERVEQAGLEVLCALVLVDRLEGGREAVEAAGHSLLSVFDRHDFLPG
ncbi:MAG: orotate phosphoribosyltransferase [Deltaproteobacteria bacterium]|nr:orotate phosphoribosyltransferase [Deltaproteobacteria bacterium]